MTAPKVILHLGLPKTATSSLQHNVLQSLHKDGRINFLGKCLSYDLMTKKLDIENYSGKFIRDGAEGNLCIDEVRKKLSSFLVKDKVNVFSDEGLMIAYPGKKNISLASKFNNLAEIFRGYDVEVVATLRDPVDYLYSLYVELYPDYFSVCRDLNTVQKYIKELMRSPDDLLFESLFYDSWIGEIKKNFAVTLFGFEKVTCGDQNSIESWASALGVSDAEFSTLFNAKKVNVKRKEGREVNRIIDFSIIRVFAKSVTEKVKPLYLFSKWFYNSFGLKYLLTRRILSNKTHEYPSGRALEQLQNILKMSSEINENV